MDSQGHGWPSEASHSPRFPTTSGAWGTSLASPSVPPTVLRPVTECDGRGAPWVDHGPRPSVASVRSTSGRAGGSGRATTGPDGGRHSAPITFVAQIDAEGWLVDQERMISRGEWEPPARQVREVHEAPLLLGEYAATVVARRRIRPGTAALYAKLLRLTILPAFAKRPLAEITAAEISTWYAGMRTTPTQQANAYGLLKSIFKEAVEELSLIHI